MSSESKGTSRPPLAIEEHQHRRPTKRDFEGKTVKRFVRTADNVYKFWFTDGTAFAIQSDLHHGLAIMELCYVCIR